MSMQSAINITLENGTRLDVYEGDTIEENMGGVSFLSLADRQISYTNSFKLPATKTNHQAFGFSANQSSKARPKIRVVIQKGIFQKKALLTVLSFDGDYQVSINYDDSDILQILNNTNLWTLPEDGRLIKEWTGSATSQQLLNEMCYPWGSPVLSTRLFAIKGYGANAVLGDGIYKRCMAYSVYEALQRFTAITGIQVVSNINLLYIDEFQFAHFINPFYFFSREFLFDPIRTRLYQRRTAGEIDVFPFVKFIKAICQIFALDFQIKDGAIHLNHIPLLLESEPVDVDGFDKWSKTIASSLAKSNYIRYGLSSKYPISSAQDIVAGDGDGEKELFKIESYIPTYLTDIDGIQPDVSGLDINEQEADKKLMVFTRSISGLMNMYLTAGTLVSTTLSQAYNSGTLTTINVGSTSTFPSIGTIVIDDKYYFNYTSVTPTSFIGASAYLSASVESGASVVLYKNAIAGAGVSVVMESGALSMDGVYSSFLNTILSSPIIIDASKIIDPLTADRIMTTRKIRSFQLSGTYWVDAMQYNHTTGMAKMKLIKL